MTYSRYDMSREAVEARRRTRHTTVHQPHPEFPHRHADSCWECAIQRDEMDAEPDRLRARLEAMLEYLVEQDQQTLLHRIITDDDGTTHYHRLTPTDLETILAHLPGGTP